MRFWSGSEPGGLKSSLDATVNRFSSKLSNELEVLRRKQAKAQANLDLTALEEVSLAPTEQVSYVKELVVQRQPNGAVSSRCLSSAAMLELRGRLKSTTTREQRTVGSLGETACADQPCPSHSSQV